MNCKTSTNPQSYYCHMTDERSSKDKDGASGGDGDGASKVKCRRGMYIKARLVLLVHAADYCMEIGEQGFITILNATAHMWTHTHLPLCLIS